MGRRLELRVAGLLASAGITLNGDQPWDIAVHDSRLFRRVMWGGLIGLGDAYVEGWWDCPAVDQLFDRSLRADLPAALRSAPPNWFHLVRESILNLQTRRRARRHGLFHYDLGDDLFSRMLDRRMIYSCAQWDGAASLDEAQERKLALICRKLDLRPGHRLLDIGCGWGGLARFAAERHGCRVVGITVSDAQARAAADRCRGLPVEVRLQDYRDVREQFDRIVSVGMFEHVGAKNHRTYMQALSRCLKDDGLSLLHFFSTRRSWPNRLDTEVAWITRRVFPGIVVPSLAQVGRAIDGLFVLEDAENIGAHYDPTLMAWCANFDRTWPELRDTYGERFRRLWRYYLLSGAGAFRSRKYSVWQMVMSKLGVRGGYRRPSSDDLERRASVEIVTRVSTPARRGEGVQSPPVESS
jgi:cyclopropane-fatty-acyl-phospholipid synthase